MIKITVYGVFQCRSCQSIFQCFLIIIRIRYETINHTTDKSITGTYAVHFTFDIINSGMLQCIVRIEDGSQQIMIGSNRITKFQKCLLATRNEFHHLTTELLKGRKICFKRSILSIYGFKTDRLYAKYLFIFRFGTENNITILH